MTDEWTAADDAVEEVREIRRRISARFGDDPVKVSAYHRALEERFRQRLAEPWTGGGDLAEDLRQIQQQLWDEFDNDPEKLAAHFMNLEKQRTPRGKQGKSAA
jgi:hypothetical protein